MSYNYQDTPPPPSSQQYQQPQQAYPPPPTYAQPGQYPPPPGHYGAPPPGQNAAPPPPGQYGAPPPSQYGPLPGQCSAPLAGQYGAPPPPPGQHGAPNTSGPPPYSAAAPLPQALPSHPPQPITFRCTQPGTGILNSALVDPWRRTAWTVSSPSPTETYIRNQSGGVVGRVEWHASPRMEFLGWRGRTGEFMPRGRDRHTRVIRYDKQNYDVVEESGVVHFRPRFDPSASYAIIRDPGGFTELEIAPPGLALGNGYIEHVILVAVLYQSGHPFGDAPGTGKGKGKGVNMGGVWGAGAVAGLGV